MNFVNIERASIEYLPPHIKTLCSDHDIHFFNNQLASQQAATEYYLSYDNHALRLNIPSLSQYPIPITESLHFQVNKKSIAGKALGKSCKTVIDATAGLGGDSIMFAKMGFNVIAIERQAVTFLLLGDAIHRSHLNNKVKLIFGNSRDIIPHINTPFQTIFFDPMYPEKKKTALANIKMRAMSVIVSELDNDFESNFEFFISHKNNTALDKKRYVVKRPLKSAVSFSDSLVYSYLGKSVRYDVY